MNETRLQELEKALQEPGEPRLSREFVQELVDEIRNLRARVYLRDVEIRDLTKLAVPRGEIAWEEFKCDKCGCTLCVPTTNLCPACLESERV